MGLGEGEGAGGEDVKALAAGNFNVLFFFGQLGGFLGGERGRGDLRVMRLSRRILFPWYCRVGSRRRRRWGSRSRCPCLSRSFRRWR